MNCKYCGSKLSRRVSYIHRGTTPNKKRISHRCHKCQITFYGKIYETMPQGTIVRTTTLQRSIDLLKDRPVIPSREVTRTKRMWEKAIDTLKDEGFDVVSEPIRFSNFGKWTYIHYLKQYEDEAKRIIELTKTGEKHDLS